MPKEYADDSYSIQSWLHEIEKAIYELIKVLEEKLK